MLVVRYFSLHIRKYYTPYLYYIQIMHIYELKAQPEKSRGYLKYILCRYNDAYMRQVQLKLVNIF